MPYLAGHAWFDPYGIARTAFGVATPAAVLLGTDGMLAGGPVQGEDDVRAFVAEVAEHLSEALEDRGPEGSATPGELPGVLAAVLVAVVDGLGVGGQLVCHRVAAVAEDRHLRGVVGRVVGDRRGTGAAASNSSGTSSPRSSASVVGRSSGLTSTSRALDPSDGPTTPRDSSRSIRRPALAKPDPQLALQHRGRAELRGDDELGGLQQQVEVVADVVLDLLLRRA